MSDRFWNWYADSCYDDLRKIRSYRVLQQRVRDALFSDQKVQRVLDLGAGTGNLLELLAGTHHDLELVGVEASSAMLRRAQSKLEGKARLLQCDLAQPLPFQNASFDAVACVNVVYAVPDPDILFYEAQRVLRSGGIFVLVNLYRPRLWWILREHLHGLKISGLRDAWREFDAVMSFAKIALVNQVIKMRAKKQIYHVWGPEALAKELEKYGFTVSEAAGDAYGGTDTFLVATV